MRGLIEFVENKTYYHGTAAKFSQFDQKKSRVPNDYYGGGVAYFTSDKSVAITYAKSAARNTKERVGRIYTCNLKAEKTFDVDHVFTGEELKNILPKDIYGFIRKSGMISASDDIYSAVAKLDTGNVKLTGDQVFRGISLGMVETARAREFLKSKGYDSLRYNGGANMSMKRHDVLIMYYANDIKIVKRQKFTLEPV